MGGAHQRLRNVLDGKLELLEGFEFNEDKKCNVALDRSPALPLNNVATNNIVLKNMVQANSTHPLFLVLGVEFYQEINAYMYPLRDRSFNALAVIKVEGC
jgi:hypothetical protein